jgi:hypothetical protein
MYVFIFVCIYTHMHTSYARGLSKVGKTTCTHTHTHTHIHRHTYTQRNII